MAKLNNYQMQISNYLSDKINQSLNAVEKIINEDSSKYEYNINSKKNVDNNIIVICFPEYVEIFYNDENYAFFYDKEISIIEAKKVIDKFFNTVNVP